MDKNKLVSERKKPQFIHPISCIQPNPHIIINPNYHPWASILQPSTYTTYIYVAGGTTTAKITLSILDILLKHSTNTHPSNQPTTYPSIYSHYIHSHTCLHSVWKKIGKISPRKIEKDVENVIINIFLLVLSFCSSLLLAAALHHHHHHRRRRIEYIAFCCLPWFTRLPNREGKKKTFEEKLGEKMFCMCKM